MISREDVVHVARLARLELSETEIERMREQLNGILRYIDKLKELDVSGVEPMAHALPLHNVLREDVVEPIRRFLIDHPEVRLELVGAIRADLSMFPEGRAALLPPVPYEKLPTLIAKSWVNIAPLCSSQYAEGKSALKLLEAAAFGCPTLASANDDVRRHHAQGAPVRLCETAQDWQRELLRSLDMSQRMELGQAARRYADEHGMAQNSLDAWQALVLEGASA